MERIIIFSIFIVYLFWALYRTWRQRQDYQAILRQGIPTQGRVLGYEKLSSLGKLRGIKVLHVEFEHEGQLHQSRLEALRNVPTGQADDPIAIVYSPEHDYQAVLDARSHQFSYGFYLLGTVIAILLLGVLLVRSLL